MKWLELSRFALPVIFLWIYWCQQLYFERYYTGILAALFAFCAVFAVVRKFRANRIDLAFCVVFAACALSQALSQDSVYSMTYFRLYMLPVPFVYFFARICFTVRDSARIVRWVSAAAAAVSIYGMYEMVSRTNVLLASVDMTFFFDFFKGKRMMATQMHPAVLGSLFAAAFPCAVTLFMLEKGRGARITAAVCAVLIALGIVLTFTRGTLIGFVCSLAALIMVFSKRKSRSFFMLGAGSLLFFLIVSLASAGNITLFLSRFDARSVAHRAAYASARIAMAVQMARDYPLTGTGPGNFRVFFDRYDSNPWLRTADPQKVPDCVFAAFLAETGMTGLIAFLVFLAMLIFSSIRAIKAGTGDAGIAIAGFACAMAGILGTFLTYDTLYWLAPGWLFWSLAGILAAASPGNERAG